MIILKYETMKYKNQTSLNNFIPKINLNGNIYIRHQRDKLRCTFDFYDIDITSLSVYMAKQTYRNDTDYERLFRLSLDVRL